MVERTSASTCLVPASNRPTRNVFLLLLCVCLMKQHPTLAYTSDDCHPDISGKAIDNWEDHDTDCMAQHKEALISGSIHEDDGSNYMEHFWDEDGGDDCGLHIWPNVKKHSALHRAAAYLRVIDILWQSGDHDTPYKTLGRVLHLVEDMGVPAHCNNDPHPAQESYEKTYCPSHYAAYGSGIKIKPPGSEPSWLRDRVMRPLCDMSDNYDSNDGDGEHDKGARRFGFFTEDECAEIADVCYVLAIGYAYGPMYRFHMKYHSGSNYFAGDPAFIQADQRSDPSVLRWETAKCRAARSSGDQP